MIIYIKKKLKSWFLKENYEHTTTKVNPLIKMTFDYSYRIEDTKTMKIENIKYKNIKIKLCLIVMYKKNYCFCIMFGYNE